MRKNLRNVISQKATKFQKNAEERMKRKKLRNPSQNKSQISWRKTFLREKKKLLQKKNLKENQL